MVRYRERTPKRRSWVIFVALCVAAWVGLWIADDLSWVFPTLLVGMFGAIAALAMWSTGVYGNITLTDTELRVGRERIALAEILPGSVAGPRDARPGAGAGPVVGGAYAPTLGSGTVSLVRRDGRPATIPARDPEALVTALRSALS